MYCTRFELVRSLLFPVQVSFSTEHIYKVLEEAKYVESLVIQCTSARLCFWTIFGFSDASMVFRNFTCIRTNTIFLKNSTREILHNLNLKIEVLADSVNTEIYVKIPYQKSAARVN